MWFEVMRNELINLNNILKLVPKIISELARNFRTNKRVKDNFKMVCFVCVHI